jgi:glycosyltransferase involved in cell wall biosynthesis
VAERTALAIELSIDDAYTYLGGEMDVATLYQAADVVAQSSKNEGYSNVLAESLASETPTVSTDCGNASAVLPADHLARVGDASGLAEAALRALSTRVQVPSPGVSAEELARSTIAAIFGMSD